MAVTNSIDFSLTAAITCTTNKTHLHHSHSTPKFTKMTFPFISILFLNQNSRTVKADSSTCSSPVLGHTETAPVIELSVNLQDFPTADHFPENNKELNALIVSLLRDSQTENLGHDYYQKAKQRQGFKPQRYTLKLVARYLIRSRNWDSLLSLCQDFQDFQVLPDKSTCCKWIISTCIKARKLKLASSFLEAFLASDKETAVLAFDFAMRGYNQLHMYSTTTGALYQKMKSSGLDLSPACYSHIMEAYLKTRHHDKAVAIFQELEDSVKYGEDEMLPRIYWILCESLGKLGRAQEALEYFREMSKHGIQANHLMYSSLISSFASSGELEIAEELLQEAESIQMLRDPALFLKLVLRYIEEGLIEKTLDIVESMKRVNIRVSDCVFCAIVNGYSKKRGFRVAARVYEDLVSRGCQPGQVTYASALNMYFRLGSYTMAETIFSEMIEKGYNNCLVAYSTMITAYGKMGRTRDAMRLVAKMKERGCEPNVWIYNSILDMNGKALNLRLVEKTWKEMRRRKVLPDRVSYTTVIGAFNRASEYETCVRYYVEYRMTGGKVDKAMAGVMVAVFSKTNRVGEIVELLQDMRVEGTKLDARFYRSAMNALRDAGLQVQAKWLEEMFKCSWFVDECVYVN